MIVQPLDEAAWNQWLSMRPAVIQEMARTHPPDRLYRMASTGHRVTLYSYEESRTVTVIVSGEFNLVPFERRVFGVSIDDLTECDGPEPGEPVGDLGLDPQDVFARINAQKESVS